MSSATAIVEALDDLLQRFGGDDHRDEVLRARSAYDERRGCVFEDEDMWEARIAAFQEWYLLDRTTEERPHPPVVTALRAEQDSARAAVLRALCTTHNSLFEVAGFAANTVRLWDLVTGTRFAVSEQRAMHGVRPGDVVELRLVGLHGAVHFARTFVYHPAGTERAIDQQVGRLREQGSSRREIVDHIASLRVKCRRYKHLSAERVYERG